MRLAKLHATGNDFLVLDARDPVAHDADLARALCDRHRGVGADGLLVLEAGEHGADATMTLYNADGGRAEMSGNGMRCLAAVAVAAGLGDGKHLVVDTDGGRRDVDLDVGESGVLHAATVDMGPVSFELAAIGLDAPSAFDLEVTVHGVTYHGDAASMGNPHLVCFVEDVAAARVTQHGPRIEDDPRFARRANVEFVHVSGPDEITMRVWERGVGETLSCGTGACAAAAVAHRRALVGDQVHVRVPGGDLHVELGEAVRLGGPVTHVFDVDVDPARILGSAR